MYYDFYHLKENPFNVTADPEFFFASKTHGDVITNLLYAIDRRKGIIAITGESGTGKTTLCQALINQADENLQIILLLDPDLSAIELLRTLIQRLEIKTKQRSKAKLLETLADFLLAKHEEGHHFALIIDEAHQLNNNQLEQLRLLSNIETAKEKLLQIVLVGQPSLSDKLHIASPTFPQYIAVYFQLYALQQTDVKDYIYHRLTQATQANQPRSLTFTDTAIETIYRYTYGIPRRINILCDQILAAGTTTQTTSIDKLLVESCAKTVFACQPEITPIAAAPASMEVAPTVIAATPTLAEPLPLPIITSDIRDVPFSAPTAKPIPKPVMLMASLFICFACWHSFSARHSASPVTLQATTVASATPAKKANWLTLGSCLSALAAVIWIV